jgi:hypothetical protein
MQWGIKTSSYSNVDNAIGIAFSVMDWRLDSSTLSASLTILRLLERGMTWDGHARVGHVVASHDGI